MRNVTAISTVLEELVTLTLGGRERGARLPRKILHRHIAHLAAQ